MGVTGVDPGCGEPRIVDPGHERLGAGLVVVGDQPGLEEVTTGSDQCSGGSDASGAYNEDSHGELLADEPLPQVGAGWYLDVETILVRHLSIW